MDVLIYGPHKYDAWTGWSLEPWSGGRYVKLELGLFLQLNRERRANIYALTSQGKSIKP